MAGASERNDLGNVLQKKGNGPAKPLIFLYENFPVRGGDHLWRGSLLPLDCAAIVKSDTSISLTLRIEWSGAASQPSGSKLPRHKSTVIFSSSALVQPQRQPIPTQLNHRHQQHNHRQHDLADNPRISIRRDSLWERACSGRRSDDGHFAGADL